MYFDIDTLLLTQFDDISENMNTMTNIYNLRKIIIYRLLHKISFTAKNGNKEIKTNVTMRNFVYFITSR